MSVSIASNPSAPRVAAILWGRTPPPAPARQITVGEYYRQQSDARIQAGLNAIGTGLHFTVEAIPGVLLIEMGAIKARHRQAAYEKIFALPWDAAGKWKVKADHILALESARADVEIRNLPMVRGMVAAGHAISTGATAVGTAIVDGATFVGRTTVAGVNAVGDGAYAAGEAVYNGSVYVAKQAQEGYKAAGRGFLGWLAMLGQSLFNWANKTKPAFAPSR